MGRARWWHWWWLAPYTGLVSILGLMPLVLLERDLAGRLHMLGEFWGTPGSLLFVPGVIATGVLARSRAQGKPVEAWAPWVVIVCTFTMSATVALLHDCDDLCFAAAAPLAPLFGIAGILFAVIMPQLSSRRATRKIHLVGYVPFHALLFATAGIFYVEMSGGEGPVGDPNRMFKHLHWLLLIAAAATWSAVVTVLAAKRPVMQALPIAWSASYLALVVVWGSFELVEPQWRYTHVEVVQWTLQTVLRHGWPAWLLLPLLPWALGRRFKGQVRTWGKQRTAQPAPGRAAE